MVNVGTIVLEAKDFILRPFREDDGPLMYKNWTSDDDVSKYMSWYTHKSVDESINYCKAWVNRYSDKNYYLWAIVDKRINEPIGSICFVKIDEENESCEIGYGMSKEYWNKGIMTNLCDIVVNFAFNTCMFKTVYIGCLQENIGSSRVIQKQGFIIQKKYKMMMKEKEITILMYYANKELYECVKIAKRYQLEESVTTYSLLLDTLLKHDIGVRTYTLFNERGIIYPENSIDKIIIPNYYSTRVIYISNDSALIDKIGNEFYQKNKLSIIESNGKSLASTLVDLLKIKKMHISFCESCTGGLIASTLISVPGASNVIDESYITYHEKAKTRILGVKTSTIDKYSVYSKEVASEMALGLYERTKTDICVSVTGLAGGDTNPMNGVFYFSIVVNGKELIIRKHRYIGSRNDVRMLQSTFILWNIYHLLAEN